MVPIEVGRAAGGSEQRRLSGGRRHPRAGPHFKFRRLGGIGQEIEGAPVGRRPAVAHLIVPRLVFETRDVHRAVVDLDDLARQPVAERRPAHKHLREKRQALLIREPAHPVFDHDGVAAHGKRKSLEERERRFEDDADIVVGGLLGPEIRTAAGLVDHRTQHGFVVSECIREAERARRRKGLRLPSDRPRKVDQQRNFEGFAVSRPQHQPFQRAINRSETQTGGTAEIVVGIAAHGRVEGKLVDQRNGVFLRREDRHLRLQKSGGDHPLLLRLGGFGTRRKKLAVKRDVFLAHLGAGCRGDVAAGQREHRSVGLEVVGPSLRQLAVGPREKEIFDRAGGIAHPAKTVVQQHRRRRTPDRRTQLGGVELERLVFGGGVALREVHAGLIAPFPRQSARDPAVNIPRLHAVATVEDAQVPEEFLERDRHPERIARITGGNGGGNRRVHRVRRCADRNRPALAKRIVLPPTDVEIGLQPRPPGVVEVGRERRAAKPVGRVGVGRAVVAVGIGRGTGTDIIGDRHVATVGICRDAENEGPVGAGQRHGGRVGVRIGGIQDPAAHRNHGTSVRPADEAPVVRSQPIAVKPRHVLLLLVGTEDPRGEPAFLKRRGERPTEVGRVFVEGVVVNGLQFDTCVILPGDDVDDTRHRIGPVDGAATVEQHLDPLDGRQRDARGLVGFGHSPLSGPGQAPTIHEDQGVVAGDPAGVEKQPPFRAGSAGVPVTRRRAADGQLRDIVSQIRQRRDARTLDELTVKRDHRVRPLFAENRAQPRARHFDRLHRERPLVLGARRRRRLSARRLFWAGQRGRATHGEGAGLRVRGRDEAGAGEECHHGLLRREVPAQRRRAYAAHGLGGEEHFSAGGLRELAQGHGGVSGGHVVGAFGFFGSVSREGYQGADREHTERREKRTTEEGR